jgi:glutaredoxin
MKTRTDLRAGALTVYGTESCGWTKKQLAYLDKKGIAYKFVNCEEQGCPNFVSGFPTLDLDGKIVTGYKEL